MLLRFPFVTSTSVTESPILNQTITLYSTLGCHLCEQAKELAWPVLSYHQLKLIEVDIANDDTLMEKFALTIPVLEKEGGQQLNWPFDQDQLHQWLSHSQ